MFYCEYWEIFKNTYLKEHLQTVAFTTWGFYLWFSDVFRGYDRKILARIWSHYQKKSLMEKFFFFFAAMSATDSLFLLMKNVAPNFLYHFLQSLKKCSWERASLRNSLQHYQKETLAQVFSCEFCEIFKNTFLKEHLRTTASTSLHKKFWDIANK